MSVPVQTISTVFSPVSQVAAVPLVWASSLTVMAAETSSAGVAVIVLVLFVVVAEYDVVLGSKLGVRVSAPIVSPERRAVSFLSPPRCRP